jgi:predicted dehydrogenase
VAQLRQRPAFELYGTAGTITVSTQAFYDDSGPTEFTTSDGRRRERHPPERSPYRHIVALGLPHLVACIGGGEQPILTAEHARHVLEISLAARESAAEGRAIALGTTF